MLSTLGGSSRTDTAAPSTLPPAALPSPIPTAPGRLGSRLLGFERPGTEWPPSQWWTRSERFTAGLLEAATPQQLSALVARELRDVFGAERVELAFVAEQGEAFSFFAASGLAVASAGAEPALPLGEVLQTGFPLWLLPDADSGALEQAPEFQSVVGCIPLMLLGECVGVVGMSFRAKPTDLSERAALFNDYVRRIALAVGRSDGRERAATAAKRASEQQRRADTAHQLNEELLALLGHELRNPLAPILSATQVLLGREHAEPVRELRLIEHHVQHLARLMDDLMAAARLSRGEFELEDAMTAVELEVAVARAVEQMNASPDASIHLDVNVPVRGLLVFADARALSQLLAELLLNAAKYTQPPGHVRLRARLADARVEVTIEDDGVGIEPELLPRIFDLFVQARQPLDRSLGGLGVGLAVARKIAELHGGTLQAESGGRGKGSRFTLSLPALAQSAVPVPARAAEVSELQAASPKRVLLVDDNKDAATLLSLLLEDAGYVVRLAHDGPAALAVAPEFLPDVALLDIGLPGMDGCELAVQLRLLLGENVPKLVAISGYGGLADRRRSNAAGFHRHLLKPIDMPALELVLRRCFEPTA